MLRKEYRISLLINEYNYQKLKILAIILTHKLIKLKIKRKNKIIYYL